MDDLRVGRVLRTARRRRNLHQRDVAALAGVSQQTVSLIERGWLQKAGLHALRSVARVLNVALPFEPRLVGGDAHDVVDARHVAVVDAAIAKLPKDEWVVRLEYSFSRYGERGCVDILAWNPRRRALLIIEAKSELLDTQDLLRTVDVRDRVLRSTVCQELGWEPVAVASIVVMADESTNRRRVARYEGVLSRGLPARGQVVRDWIANPSGDLRGLLFVTVREDRRVQRNPGGIRRVRRQGSDA